MEMSALEAAAKAENSSGNSSMRDKVSTLASRSVLIPMALLVFLFFTQSFSGSNMVSYYTVTILQMAEIPMDENISAILVAAQYVLGYAISSVLVTRVGRRSLLIGSLVLMMLANLGAGFVLLDKHEDTEDIDGVNVTNNAHVVIVDADNLVGLEASNEDQLLEEGPHGIYSYIPVISCVFITFGYACGLGPVPFILFGELFPSNVRGSATSITAFLRSITVFLSIKIFPSLLWLCGIGGSFLSCALVCGFAIVVAFLCVPETRGMDLEQLETIYKKKPQDVARSQSSDDGRDHEDQDTCASLLSSPTD